jgi:hypothetical protein
MKLRLVYRIAGGALLVILMSLPSILIYIGQKHDEEIILTRSIIADYLVFSHSIHMRSYWAMSNIDYAIEAGANAGDYGCTTMYFPLYASRAADQTSVALEEISDYRGVIPQQAQPSYQYMCSCIEELDSLALTLKNMPFGVVPMADLVPDSMITSWDSRQALRDRFALRSRAIDGIRSAAVRDGYDWVYTDMELKAVYDINVEQGQAMFQSSSF